MSTANKMQIEICVSLLEFTLIQYKFHSVIILLHGFSWCVDKCGVCHASNAISVRL